LDFKNEIFKEILAFFGLAMVSVTFFQKLGNFFIQSSGHPGPEFN
jgi:hypothetical protein